MELTSDAKVIANRRNAARSTGPRTGSGKAKSRLNALRHGLASQQPIASADVIALAKAICEQHRSQLCLEPAMRIAESVLTLRKIGEITLAIVKAGRLAESTKELASLQRYERRALSRQKGALDDFVEAQHVAAGDRRRL